jgi:hypothetical protein
VGCEEFLHADLVVRVVLVEAEEEVVEPGLLELVPVARAVDKVGPLVKRVR